MTNLNSPFLAPRKLEDGTYVWEFPQASEAPKPFPYIDTEHDYGLFVRYAIETPEYRKGGKAIYTYGELLHNSEVVEVLKRGTS